MIGRKPATEDYVPLVPWLGVMWWGMAALVPAVLSPLSWLGRWSLTWYMLHQPVMIGALMAWAAWSRSS